MNQHKTTSWQPVAKWYQKAVGDEGLYYHQHIVLPYSLNLLHLSEKSSLLDLACGQGVLERAISKETEYCGLDLSKDLIKSAQNQAKSDRHHFKIADITKDLPIQKYNFTHASVILAIQNIERPQLVFTQAAKHLVPGGKLLIVMNHPCFRIPRQSSWEIDDKNKLEYRRINRYMSPLKIPITAHPGKGQRSPVTWSFHYPLQDYTQALGNCGFNIETLQEWTSDKNSSGKAAKMENRARTEFPLFLAILAIKK